MDTFTLEFDNKTSRAPQHTTLENHPIYTSHHDLNELGEDEGVNHTTQIHHMDRSHLDEH